MVAQDQALRTNTIKVKTDEQEGDVRCRMCKDKEETVTHLKGNSTLKNISPKINIYYK